jgi:hypothetical protein
MALAEEDFQLFKSELARAASELKSNELTYVCEWVFELPTASLSIAGVALHERYRIPVGLTGYGETDLKRLEDLGFLTKISESETDPITFEKTITYRINI